ncbi:uncharacterized protein LOC62_05G007748 [Vanrija pseudolonga]|uniref:Uncharacterized protein n=1 Tax=Vanrija pseudolonga TaxID=143232 RepID=A0AAF0YGK3_9TREE|nr:hypothetical protein LOC62_05G007748 [Vanrija pseudolonga]
MSTRRRPSNVIWSAEQAVAELHAAESGDARVAVLHAYLGLKAARGKTRAEVRAKLLALAGSVPEYADAFVRVSADLGLGGEGDDMSPTRRRQQPLRSATAPVDAFPARPLPRHSTSDDAAAHALAHHHASAGFARRSSSSAAVVTAVPARPVHLPVDRQCTRTGVSPHALAAKLEACSPSEREMKAAASLAGGYDDEEDEWEAYYAAASARTAARVGERKPSVRM